MRTFLLLLLSLMTGCEALSNVKGCRDGWVEFTCNYPEQNGKDNNITYNTIDVFKSRKTHIIQSSKENEWETTNSVSLYHDTNNKSVIVLIKKLKQEDFAEYQCEEQGSAFNTVKLNRERVGCQGEFIQTAYRTAKTTITCNDQGNRDESDVLFFCKENKITCEDILSTESSPKSNGTFTLTETNRGFNVSISNVSSHHAGVYWCGVKSNKGRSRAGLRKIQLEVKDITPFTVSLTIGQNFTYWCDYPNGTPIKKFICKGEDPSICEPLVHTMQLDKNTGRFSMKDDNKKRNITITVREVTTDDTGTYWCGAKSPDDKRSNPFFHRISMTVVQTSRPTTPSPLPPPAPTQTPTPTSPVSSAQCTTTSTSAENNSGSRGIITVTVCVGVLLLLLVPFVLILFFIYKRFSQSKNTRNAATAQNIREEATYAKVQKRHHMPDSKTAKKTIYTTANYPKNHSSASHEDPNTHIYSNVKYTYRNPSAQL